MIRTAIGGYDDLLSHTEIKPFEEMNLTFVIVIFPYLCLYLCLILLLLLLLLLCLLHHCCLLTGLFLFCRYLRLLLRVLICLLLLLRLVYHFFFSFFSNKYYSYHHCYCILHQHNSTDISTISIGSSP